MLYEEEIKSKALTAVLALSILPMIIAIYATRNIPQASISLSIGLIVLLGLTWDLTGIRIVITDREVKIRGRLGLIIRKTVRLDEVEGYMVGHHWMACQLKAKVLHFTLPAKGCIVLFRRKGLAVSFSTNNPDEISAILSTLGIPRSNI
ncbi:hypothetical protein [Pyrococcus sp. ST04]|uniref:hypothetical protein n=1 Tax=Pyrococcus sp. ST04 TaxID=1183377 RepID=UPI0002605AF9|nr:hypothetical protein [Pyrococcus sp. ST04]AFK22804.1 hypothetical protein Py04_1230 [Pyrococcus sp. ST04]